MDVHLANHLRLSNKIMLNKKFTKPYGWTTLPIISAASILILLAVYYSVLMWFDLSAFEQEITKLDTTTKQFQQKTVELESRNVNAPTKKQVANLEEKLYRLSQIFVEAKSSVLLVFNKLENILPESVYIKQLNHNGASTKTIIIALADNSDGISAFLESLEADKDYVSVLLKRQSHIKLKNKNYIEFEILIDELEIK